ncbi:MAG: LCP family protein [Clostridia bacterium]|nr:LCP family protein [Clostridia bacterium]
MWIKKTVAMLVALGIMLCGVSGALAEDDVVADLLYYFLGDSAEQGEEAEAPQQTAPEQADAANEESADYVDGEDYMDEDTGEYGFDEEEEEIVVDKLVEVTDYAVNENLPDDWTNVLLLGTDSRGSTKYLRTDTMIVLSVNANTNEAKMTSILRDTWVEIPEYGWQKLNAACVYGGPELTMRTINQYFGLNLKSYALVNMQCLVNIVDALGGVRLDISPAEAGAMNRLITSDAEASDGNRNFATDKVHSGEQVLLNGKQTLAYARIRKLDTDYARTARQRTVLTTIARQMQQVSVFSLATLVTDMLQYVETNLSFDQIMTIAAVCMKLDLDNLAEFRIPADGTFEAGMFGNTWCIKPDFEANAALVKQFIYGE